MKELMNERYKNIMRQIMMFIMAVALIALPTMAQEWQSTSAMQGTGSEYAPQVTAVGAASAATMATTTENYTSAQAPTGKRRIDVYTPTTDPNAPIGDAVLPLMLMALAFCGVMYYRRKKANS